MSDHTMAGEHDTTINGEAPEYLNDVENGGAETTIEESPEEQGR